MISKGVNIQIGFDSRKSKLNIRSRELYANTKTTSLINMLFHHYSPFFDHFFSQTINYVLKNYEPTLKDERNWNQTARTPVLQWHRTNWIEFKNRLVSKIKRSIQKFVNFQPVLCGINLFFMRYNFTLIWRISSQNTYLSTRPYLTWDGKILRIYSQLFFSRLFMEVNEKILYVWRKFIHANECSFLIQCRIYYGCTILDLLVEKSKIILLKKLYVCGQFKNHEKM